MLGEFSAQAKNLVEGLSTNEVEMYKDISDDLRCPTCTGLSILQSDAQFSIQMKEAVREQVLTGKSKQDIMKFFTERYGLWILREPPSKGVHMLAWIIPGALLLLGPFLIWFFVWRKRQTVKTFGVRSTEEILAEMNNEIQKLKSVNG
jgi:cytochrome c-type biogenesis protein CcmH